jgi:hypothetical protein
MAYCIYCITGTKTTAVSGFLDKLQICATAFQLDTTPTDYKFSIKPDLCVYANTSDNSTRRTGTHSSLVEFFFEFKSSSHHDPFSDGAGQPDKPFVKNTKGAMTTLGQISTYLAFQMGSQYRTHTFFVLIVADYARLLRWDRSGVVVSERIKYNEQRELVTFLELFNAATPEIRGSDQSVFKPLENEKEDAVRACVEFKDMKDTLLAIKFFREDEKAFRRYVIASPRAGPCVPLGRTTRTSIAYDVREQKRVFMKDSWRVEADGCRKEGEVYKILNGKSVPNVPQCIDFCDVDDEVYHQTQTQTFVDEFLSASSPADSEENEKKKNRFNTHRHHRLILDTVGKDLKSFNGSYELVKAICDALIGTAS